MGVVGAFHLGDSIVFVRERTTPKTGGNKQAAGDWKTQLRTAVKTGPGRLSNSSDPGADGRDRQIRECCELGHSVAAGPRILNSYNSRLRRGLH